jgi:glycosyltransferase involved in cell wall biosynthesis
MTAPLATTRGAPRYRILLSAFACSPLWGSEPGVGWRWALELARRHDVTVVTHACYREQIEPLQAQLPAGLRFSWYTVPGIGGHPHRQIASRLYYWLWQAGVRSHVRRLLAVQPHDLVHHLTWGSYRFPSFLGRLGVPLVVGPVGGGESAPLRLWHRFPWRERVFYAARQLSIVASRWDPFVMWGLAGAACVLTRTEETCRALPWFARARAERATEIGVTEASVAGVRPRAPRSATDTAPLRLLYAGRLIGGKGVPYLLPMMQALVQHGVPVHLTLAGDGRMAGWVREQVERHRLQAHVHLAGHLPRERMAALYGASDLMVFPSWHDSSGTVVTEALAHGLPVLCLDLGGPRYTVDPRCGRIVCTTGLDQAGVALALAGEVRRLAEAPDQLARLSEGATQRAREVTWARQVERAYALIESRLGWPAAAGAPPQAVQAQARPHA